MQAQLITQNDNNEFQDAKLEAERRYKKLSGHLRAELKGKGYHRALTAFAFGQENHPGYRKDGITPNFQHQIEICLFILTLKEVKFEEDTLISALLHDVREDAHIPHDQIRQKFGDKIADVVEKLTKEFKGTKKDTQYYFDEIATCPIASIVKLADRVHNVSSMVGVFTIPKQEAYIIEIEKYFLPMLKKARSNFPEQLSSYYGINTFLKTMVHTVKAVLSAEKQVLDLKEMQKINEDNNADTVAIKPKMKH